MSCRLCKEDPDLQRSHIIPEFLFKPGYDDKGRLFEVEADSGRKSYIQKGYREYLLCTGCEGRIGRFEKYFADLWYQTSPLPDPVTEESVVLTVDYSQFKLFLLSILWRASVSSHEAFKAVQLGPFEDEIRKMLLSSDPGPDTRFQIFGCIYLLPQTRTPCHGTVRPPDRAKVHGGITTYSFIFGGVGWYFVISKRVVEEIRAGGLTEAGTVVLIVDDLTGDRSFSNIFGEHVKNARRRSR